MQAAQNCKPMGIDIAPISDIEVTQPLYLRQAIDAVPGTEYHHVRRHLRKRQRVGFALCDEHPLDARVQRRKLRHGNRQI